jgi:hypothetical protein
MLKAEQWQICGEVWVLGKKEDKSSTWHGWAAGFHHVTAHSRLACILKLMNRLFL